VSIDLQ
jgi:hypothetical protein